MDGATKFVRGDAIAGLLIVFINIIGGIIIGVVQKGMTFIGQPRTPTPLLTVGDGLVIADPGADRLHRRRHAGVQGRRRRAPPTRRCSASSRCYPQALGMAAFLMVALAVLPGMPALPFLLLAGVTGGIAFVIRQRRDAEGGCAEEQHEAACQAADRAGAEEPITRPWRSTCCASNWATACCR